MQAVLDPAVEAGFDPVGVALASRAVVEASQPTSRIAASTSSRARTE